MGGHYFGQRQDAVAVIDDTNGGGQTCRASIVSIVRCDWAAGMRYRRAGYRDGPNFHGVACHLGFNAEVLGFFEQHLVPGFAP